MPSADHARAFYLEVAVSEEVYGLEYDDREDGVPLWPLGEDRLARPFWSSPRRVREMLDGPLARKRLRIVAYTWHGFIEGIMPELEAEDILVGVNWHGRRAKGYNMPVHDVVAAVEAARADHAPKDGPRPTDEADDSDPASPELRDEPKTEFIRSTDKKSESKPRGRPILAEDDPEAQTNANDNEGDSDSGPSKDGSDLLDGIDLDDSGDFAFDLDSLGDSGDAKVG